MSDADIAALVAEKVLRWVQSGTVWQAPDWPSRVWRQGPPALNGNLAVQVIEALRGKGWELGVEEDGAGWVVTYTWVATYRLNGKSYGEATDLSLPRAVCLAALRALEVSDE